MGRGRWLLKDFRWEEGGQAAEPCQGMEWKGQAGDTMVLPLEALPRVSSWEAEVALKIGVWTSQEQRVGEEETASHNRWPGRACDQGGHHYTLGSYSSSSYPDCLSPAHPESPLERKEGTWVSLVPYLWRQPAGF